jgi:hypothetical protein
MKSSQWSDVTDQATNEESVHILRPITPMLRRQLSLLMQSTHVSLSLLLQSAAAAAALPAFLSLWVLQERSSKACSLLTDSPLFWSLRNLHKFTVAIPNGRLYIKTIYIYIYIHTHDLII